MKWTRFYVSKDGVTKSSTIHALFKFFCSISQLVYDWSRSIAQEISFEFPWPIAIIFE